MFTELTWLLIQVFFVGACMVVVVFSLVHELKAAALMNIVSCLWHLKLAFFNYQIVAAGFYS